MQKLTVDELKRLLYDTFCEHLSMKDIENIIMTEEESHLGTAEECPVDVESEWPALGRCGWVPVLQQGLTPRVCTGGHLLIPAWCSHLPLVKPLCPSADLIPSLRCPPLSRSLVFLVGGCSLFQPADPPDVRAQEPDLRLCHRLHHQCHAHRGQPGAAQRHEVGTTWVPAWRLQRPRHTHRCLQPFPPACSLGHHPDMDHPSPHPIGLAWSHGPAVEDLVVALRTALAPIPCLCPHLACV